MDDNCSENYSLSAETIDKLKNIKAELQHCQNDSDNIWRTIFYVEDEPADAMDLDDDALACEIAIEPSQKSQVPDSDDAELRSTQFYFTQTKPKEPLMSSIKPRTRSLSDVIESLYTALEASTGSLEAEDIEALIDTNATEIIDNLSRRLSAQGCLNLCSSICDMPARFGSYYPRIIFSKLLFQKILNPDHIPRTDLTTLSKMAEKFPEDFCKFIIIPLLQVQTDPNVNNVKAVSKLIKSYPESTKKELLSDFVEVVMTLKPSHILILQDLVDIKLENDGKTSILALFADKAMVYADDRNYSQCILLFMKSQSPFTDEQKNMLQEIVIVHKSIFRNPLKSMLGKMFLHRDLWHIS